MKKRLKNRYTLFNINLIQAKQLAITNHLDNVAFNKRQGYLEADYFLEDEDKIKRQFENVFKPYLLYEKNRNFKEVFVSLLKSKGFHVALAESLTGGMITSFIIDEAGASLVLNEAFVTYGNDAKITRLNIDKAIIDKHGVVSAEVAMAMILGLKKNTKAEVLISTTGYAGPLKAKEAVGSVYFGFCIKDDSFVIHRNFQGKRNQIRKAASTFALLTVIDYFNKHLAF